MSDKMPAASAVPMVHQTLIHQLWPFEDELLGANARGSRGLRYACHAVQQMWVLQHSTVLHGGAALPLIRALQTTLGGLSLPPDMQAWVTLVEAQQRLFMGHQAQARQMLDSLLRADKLTADVWAASLCVGFHAAVLSVSPWQTHADTDGAQPCRVETLSRALADIRLWRDRRNDLFEHCSPKAQAQLVRIGVVVDALDGQELDRTVWLRMASDMAKPVPSIARAYSQLASAWVFLTEGKTLRATVAFEAALSTSNALGWRFGGWVAAYELDLLRHPDDRHGGRVDRLPCHLLDWTQTTTPNDVSDEAPTLDSAARLRVAKQYIQGHLARRISILEVAAICGVSPRTLTQDFHAGEGQTPLEYINALKVHQADEWLKEGRSIREVATAVGFETVLGFVKAYVRVHGAPPAGVGG
jgi:AraC-like DNA-binding protein